MVERRQAANFYANAIIEDIQNAFIREETKTFSDEMIVREYEFEDGAIIKYEWQTAISASRGEPFNHRFTLVKLPGHNPENLALGVVKQMDY